MCLKVLKVDWLFSPSKINKAHTSYLRTIDDALQKKHHFLNLIDVDHGYFNFIQKTKIII